MAAARKPKSFTFTHGDTTITLPPFDAAKRVLDDTIAPADFKSALLMSHAERDALAADLGFAYMADAFKTVVAHVGSATDAAAEKALALLESDPAEFGTMFGQWVASAGEKAVNESGESSGSQGS